MMNATSVKPWMLELYECGLGSTSSPVQRIVDALHAVDSQFVTDSSPPYDRKIISSPLGYFSTAETEVSFTAQVIHPTLAHNGLYKEDVPLSNAAKLIFLRADDWLGFAQYESPADIQATATGLLDFGMLVVPHLSPAFSQIASPSQRQRPWPADVSNGYLRSLGWACFFGPPFIAKYGLNNILAAPCWRVTQLSNECIVCVMTPTYQEWVEGRQDRILRHFRRLEPDVRWAKR